jgi:hypothetical protein
MLIDPTDPFGLNLELTPEQAAGLAPLQKKPAPRFRQKPTGKSRQQSGFVMMTHETAKVGYLALRCPQAIVWYYIHYRVWADGQRTVPLPNKTLASLGVTRWVKQRALRNLERARLVRVEYRGRKSPLVTLLTRPH